MKTNYQEEYFKKIAGKGIEFDSGSKMEKNDLLVLENKNGEQIKMSINYSRVEEMKEFLSGGVNNEC